MSNEKILLEIEDLRDKRRTAEQALQQAGRSRTIGLAGVLLGLLLVIPVAPLGILLLLAGALAAFTQASKSTEQKKLMAQLDGQIKALREQVA